VFGAEVFHRAKIIKDLELLENLTNKSDRQEIPPNTKELNEFFFSYLTDTINILIFFENYMKAELIIRGFCVHIIKKDIPEFKEIAKKQFREPILMKDINAIEAFEVNADKKEIFHRGIKETTIGMKELIGSEKYLSNYQFNIKILKFIKELTVFRNKLHFHESIEFTTSVEKIEILKEIKVFVKETIENRKINKNGN
jgi:hypothetical protein